MNYARYKKRERLISVIITIIVSITIYFLYIASFKTITSPYLTLRQDPKFDTPLIYITPKSQQYAIITTNNNWSYIYTNGQLGWVPNDEFNKDTISTSEYVIAVKPENDNVSVFSNPRESEKESGKMDQNTIYYVYYKRNNWSQIIYNNQIMWVDSEKLITP